MLLSESQLTPRRWLVSSFLGWIAGVFLVIFTSVSFDAIGLEGFQFYLGISIGAGVGFLQWRILKRAAGFNTSWIVASMFGMGFPFLLNDLLSRSGLLSFGSYYLAVSVVAGALVVSLWQYRILSAYSSSASGWPAISFAGWIAASLTVFAVDYVKLVIHHNLALFFINLALIVSGGAVLGLVTGRTMSSCIASVNTSDPT